MKNFFHHNAIHMMSQITKRVLNHHQVLHQVYKNMSLSRLFTMMANIKNNAFIIGSSKMWIVNCATSHKGHFVGSCQNMKLSSGSRDVAKWKKV
jgi:hypothetical protein